LSDQSYLVLFSALFAEECSVPLVPVDAPVDPNVEFVVPLTLRLADPVVLGPFSALLAPECNVPFVPALAPVEPIPEFTLPFRLSAEATELKLMARPVRRQIVVCFIPNLRVVSPTRKTAIGVDRSCPQQALPNAPSGEIPILSKTCGSSPLSPGYHAQFRLTALRVIAVPDLAASTFAH
jgi:hypothetical protein